MERYWYSRLFMVDLSKRTGSAPLWEPRYNKIMKTATLNNSQWVEVLELDSLRGLAYVMDDDGGEFQVSVNQLDNIEDSIEVPSQSWNW